jgi:hypothetical protein
MSPPRRRYSATKDLDSLGLSHFRNRDPSSHPEARAVAPPRIVATPQNDGAGFAAKLRGVCSAEARGMRRLEEQIMNATMVQATVRSPQALRAICVGGLIGGTLDILYASTATILAGSTPDRMLRSIAAGLLGRGVISGGWEFAVLGLALHFFIALSAATTYYLASRKLTFLIAYALVCGPLFGAIWYLFMNRVVLPLSALAVSPKFQWPGFLAVTFLIGVPIALSVRYYSR